MLIEFNDEDIDFVRNVVSHSEQSASARIRLLDKIREAGECGACGNCKNGFCRHSLQNVGRLHGDCCDHARFESV